MISHKMTHLYDRSSLTEPTSPRKNSDKDPNVVTYVLFFNGLNSIADMNGVPSPVFTRQTCI